MFGKVLKYDLLATFKLFLLGAMLSLMGGVGGGVLIRIFLTVSDHDADNLFLVLSGIFSLFMGIFCLLAIVLPFFLTKILVYVRFYKHFFTDEGYLTFTLPVKRSTLFLSKNVSALILFAAQFAVTALSFLLFAILVTPPRAGGFFFNFAVLKGIGELFASSWSAVGAWTLVYLLELLLIALAYLIFSTLLVYFCIAFGAMLVKRGKLLLSVVLYYAITSLLGTVGEVAMLVCSPFVLSGIFVLTEGASQNQTAAVYAVLFLSVLAVLSVLASALYSTTQLIIDRKLNLA